MTERTETRVLESRGSQEAIFAAGDVATATVTQPMDGVPVVRPIALATRGRVEFTGRCPCGAWHRHVHLGLVTGPCGTQYELRPRKAAVGRAA
ncbi:hypothetical protein [Streptomyces boninensis]|uniref:hypothetical protein n=1 Tax=Streptomyces boninensis TaxID=2039455 RepID=UPI003B2126A8